MATVTIDELSGLRARRTRNGWEAERVAIVTDVDISSGDLLQTAAEDAGVPQIGAGHPTMTGLILVEQIPTAEATTTAKVRLLYRVPTAADTNPDDPDAVQIEVGTTLRSVETNKNLAGNILSVEWRDAPEDQKVQFGTITKDVPITTLILRRRESNSPGSISKTYTGTLNAEPFQGDSAALWKCTGITGASDDNGDNYDVVYSFEFSPTGWQQLLLWIDPDTGRQPDGAGEGDEPDGVVTVSVYELKDWSELNLPNG